ncbi:MAG: hypothetical protein N2C14_11335 [Planctomycetales bacterium]
MDQPSLLMRILTADVVHSRESLGAFGLGLGIVVWAALRSRKKRIGLWAMFPALLPLACGCHFALQLRAKFRAMEREYIRSNVPMSDQTAEMFDLLVWDPAIFGMALSAPLVVIVLIIWAVGARHGK